MIRLPIYPADRPRRPVDGPSRDVALTIDGRPVAGPNRAGTAP